MDFALTEEQRILRENARRFLEREIAPHVQEQESKGPMDRGTAGVLIKKLVDFGFVMGPFPPEIGGNGLDEQSHGVMTEELWRVWPALGVMVLVDPAPVEGAIASGNEGLAQRVVLPILRGEKLGCGAITEPNVGSNPRAVETTAVREGDHYVVNGTKMWITNGGVADFVMCLCKVKGEPGLSQLIIEKEASPFTTRELDKLGLKASPTSELHFEDCRVPVGNRVVPESGLKQTLKGFERARAMLAIGAVGISQACLEAALTYAGERKQWGKTLAGHQTIQHMIDDPAHDCRDGHTHRRRPLPRLPRFLRHGPGPEGRERDLDGQVLLLRERSQGFLPGSPGPRRVRAFERVPAGTVLPGRAHPHDPRRHKRDPEDDRSPGAAQGERVLRALRTPVNPPLPS